MNCFYHQERVSIGICRSCMRGLCSECAADSDAGLACTGRHEEAVARIGRSLDTHRRLSRVAPFFFVALGFIFALSGYTTSHSFLDFSVISGACFIVFGLAAFQRLAATSRSRPKA